MKALAVILSILNSALTVLPEGTDLYNKFKAQRDQAQQWRDSNHKPTADEWAQLDALVASKEDQVDQLTR
jgi:hypothetical protein